jgi:hypothetical protein
MWGLLLLIAIVIIMHLLFGLCFQHDLKEIEKHNPEYRKFLKDKYDI